MIDPASFGFGIVFGYVILSISGWLEKDIVRMLKEREDRKSVV